jgi:HK97 family phage major capsid protein
MNRERLLAFARSKGFKGKADLAELRTWLTDQGFDPDAIASGGKTFKLDDVWAKAASIELESDPEPEPEPEPKAKAAPPVQTGKGYAKVGRVDSKTDAEPMTAAMHQRLAEKSAYKRRIKSGTAAFDDADTAERAGAFFRLAMTKNLEGAENYGQKARDLEIVGKDMSEGINSAGGALVPQEFDPTLIWLTEQYGVARRIARVQRMSRDSLIIPRRTSLLAMTALGEGGTMTATNNAYDNIELTAKKWGVLIKSSSELLEDSAVNVADDITKSVAEAQAYAEDNTYFNGTGTSTYNGCTGLAAALPSGAYDAASNNTWASQVEADLLGLVGEVVNVKWGQCAFVCSRQFFWAVPMRLAQAKSGNTVSTMLLGPERGPMGEDAMLYGFPCYFSQVMPVAGGAAQDILYFGDFKSASVLGDRRDLRIDFSDQRYFDSDQVAWRGTSRFTVNIHGDGRATTVGPIAALHTTG